MLYVTRDGDERRRRLIAAVDARAVPAVRVRRRVDQLLIADTTRRLLDQVRTRWSSRLLVLHEHNHSRATRRRPHRRRHKPRSTAVVRRTPHLHGTTRARKLSDRLHPKLYFFKLDASGQSLTVAHPAIPETVF